MSTKPYRRSAATAILARAGVFQREIAERLHQPVSTVGQQLSGRITPHPRLIAVIEELSNPNTARQVEETLSRIAAALEAANDA